MRKDTFRVACDLPAGELDHERMMAIQATERHGRAIQSCPVINQQQTALNLG